MKNTLALYFSLLLAGTITSLSAQIDYPADGRIVTTDGATLVGQINLDNEVLLSKGIHWKAAGNDNQTFYGPTELREFSFTESGRIYRPIEHTFVRIDDSIKQVATRFARVIYDGPLKLYRLGVLSDEFYKVLEDIPSWAYYLQLEDGTYVKLEVTEKQINSVMGYPYAKYRGPLKYVMRDWPGANQRIDATNFQDDELSALIQDYVAFRYPNAAVEASEKPKRVTSFSSYLHASYAGGWGAKFEQEEFFTNAVGAGYYLKVYNPYVDNSVEFAIGLEYLKLNYLPEQEQINTALRVFNGSAFRVPVIAEYYLTNKSRKIQPRLTGSLLASFLRREGENLRTELRIVNGRREIVPIGYFPFTNKAVSFHFGIGLGVDLFEQLRVDLQYERNLGLMFRAAARL